MGQTRLIPLLAALFLPVAGGFDFVFIEYISEYIDSVNLVFIKLLVSAIAFLAAVRIAEGGLKIRRRDFPRFLISGGLGNGSLLRNDLRPDPLRPEDHLHEDHRRFGLHHRRHSDRHRH